jgi:hypothetical protein
MYVPMHEHPYNKLVRDMAIVTVLIIHHPPAPVMVAQQKQAKQAAGGEQTHQVSSLNELSTSGGAQYNQRCQLCIIVQGHVTGIGGSTSKFWATCTWYT